MTDDLISRQAAIDAIRKIYDSVGILGEKWAVDKCQMAIKDLPSAQQERIIYGNMSDEEFEKWLYGHGICNPNIRESIPCDVVPLLIDNAISELPSAQPERKTGHWIKTARWGRVYYCDQCRNYLDFDGVNAGRGSTNFCPNCGAKMELKK